ncbi:MAG: EAL domain-containing protein [Lachnospiraceae bacterium]|nr:EAL domain-containing protein [Lachnospiraceae bacterium]
MNGYSISLILDGAGFQVSTILVSASCLYYLKVHRSNLKQLHNRLFRLMLLNVCITAICNLLSAFLNPIITTAGPAFWARYIGQFIYFLLHPLLAPLFCFYVAQITGAQRRMKQSHRFLYEAPMYLCILMALANPVTKWIYHYDENLVYTRSSGVYIIYIISTLYFIAAVVILCFFWEAVSRTVRHVLVYFFVQVAVGTIVQLIFPQAHTELICQAIALTAIMITVENEDTRRDPRTGIQNHAALAQDIRRCLKSGSPFHIISIKMQNPLNLMQIIGQANIEKLTEMTAEYLGTLTEPDNIYYVGPGTFVIMLETPDDEADLATAEAVRERFLSPWDFQGHKNTFEAAVFFARIPEDFKKEEEVTVFLTAPVPRDFHPTSGVCQGMGLDFIIRRSRVEKTIMNGLKNKGFEVYYQPIYSAKTMSICSGEALLRLHDDAIGQLYPDEFLPIAERGGLIFELGDFVLEEVCKFLNSGIPVEMGVETLHINLSVVQCLQTNYAQRIIDIVSKYQINPSCIDFEIMESAATTDFTALNDFVDTLRSHGFSFSVDDYGIGYSNIHSIFHLDIGSVKIDKSILREAETTETGRIILESSIGLINRMGKKIISSGVENQSQVDLAAQFGIDYLQGFYFSNPISQSEFINVLKATKLAKIEEQKAIASNEAMTSFLANMSHEIRTPINAVLGMDEMILRESKDDKVLEYAKTIEGAGRTLLSLINDILDFSKIESGKMDIFNHDYDLSSVLLDVTGMMRMKAQQKNLTLLLDADPSLPDRLVGDEMRLRQVLLNILNNAVKYTEKGTVTLKVSYQQTDPTHITLILAVKDTGIGIKEEDLDNLFVKFSRLDMNKNKTIEGTGLGLAITKQILTLMDGTISVESVYGKGSTFTVQLPQVISGQGTIGNLTTRQKHKEQEGPVVRPFIAPDVDLLVVDDTTVNHVVVRELLSKTKIRVDEAISGKECLQKVCEKHYDLILLDYRMPEMNGIETLHNMEDLPGNKSRDAVIIALTANAISGARERFLNEGFADYITKPVSGQHLEETLLLHLPPEKIQWLDASGSEGNSQAAETKSGQTQNTQVSAGQANQPAAGEAGQTRTASDTTNTDKPSENPADDNAKTQTGNLSESSTGDAPDAFEQTRTALIKSGVDVNAGITNCGSEESFHKVLQVFLSDIPTRSEFLRTAFADRDWERYCTEAHAIKSSSRIIGAGHLSQLAERMELAAEQGDIKTLEKYHEELLSLYENIRDMDGLPKTEEKPPLDEKTRLDALETLKEFIFVMDSQNAEFVIESLRSYNLDENQKKKLAQFENLVFHLDFEKAETMLDELLKSNER